VAKKEELDEKAKAVGPLEDDDLLVWK